MTEVEIPTHYKACVYDAPGKVSTKVEQIEMPEPVGRFEALSAFSRNASCLITFKTCLVMSKGLEDGDADSELYHRVQANC